MRAGILTFSFLGTVCLSLITFLEPWFQGWAGSRAKSGNLITVALGDSRRLFAKHFYVKADAYFHNGYYPSIYDNHPPSEDLHMASDRRVEPGTTRGGGSPASADHEEGEDFLGKPKDWIDAFSRHFFPSTHRHLGEEAHHDGKPGSHGEEKHAAGEEREVLPWLRLSATLDPERPETYLIASFWLRTRLGKADEAERFLREGLQTNPNHYELLLELGHIYKETRKDPDRARNVWEVALRNWRETEAGKPEPNILPYAQLLGELATLEEARQNYPKALEHLAALEKISPNRASIQKWMEDLKARSVALPHPAN